jgi:hypothetical protein
MLCHACSERSELGSGERVGFHDTCPRCSADLHVCLNCVHRDAGAYNGCREPSAERVLDPARANRCEYFRPADRTTDASESTRSAALGDLEALFRKN